MQTQQTLVQAEARHAALVTPVEMVGAEVLPTAIPVETAAGAESKLVQLS